MSGFGGRQEQGDERRWSSYEGYSNNNHHTNNDRAPRQFPGGLKDPPQVSPHDKYPDSLDHHPRHHHHNTMNESYAAVYAREPRNNKASDMHSSLHSWKPHGSSYAAYGNSEDPRGHYRQDREYFGDSTRNTHYHRDDNHYQQQQPQQRHSWENSSADARSYSQKVPAREPRRYDEGYGGGNIRRDDTTWNRNSSERENLNHHQSGPGPRRESAEMDIEQRQTILKKNQNSGWESEDEQEGIIRSTKLLPPFVAWNQKLAPLWTKAGFFKQEVVDEFQKLRPDETSKFEVIFRPRAHDATGSEVIVESSQENVDLFLQYLDRKVAERRRIKQEREQALLRQSAAIGSGEQAAASRSVPQQREESPSPPRRSRSSSPASKRREPEQSYSRSKQHDERKREALAISVEPRVEKKSKGASCYQYFFTKIRPAAEIEFEGAGLNVNSILGKMWTRHKQRHGETCNDDCKCVLHLKDLGSNVRSTKKPMKFMSEFADKMYPKLQSKYPSDKPARLLERLIDLWKKQAPAAPRITEANDVQTEQAPKTGFADFQAKVKEAVEIEYKNAGIHRKTITSSMWGIHKDLYGETCDGDCECLFRLKDLAANVVSTAINKDNGWTNPLNLGVNDMPVGFIKFSAKFLSKLRSQYPSEQPTSLFERLISQWEQRHAPVASSSLPVQEKSSKRASYNNFLLKVKDAVNIEFADAGLHHKSIKSIMWDRHKLLLGASCDDDCQCIFRLKDLASTVVSTAMEKVSDWTNPLKLRENELPVGVITFVTECLPKLQTKHPSEPPCQLMMRSIRLWEKTHGTSPASSCAKGALEDTSCDMTKKTSRDSYWRFYRKIKSAACIEFEDSLSVSLTMRLMWESHKEIIGPNCDDNCQCVFHLKELGFCTIEKALNDDDDSSEPLDLQLNKMPVGFLSKLEKRLRQLHSQDSSHTPAELLERVVTKWLERHREGASTDVSLSADGESLAQVRAYRSNQLPTEQASPLLVVASESKSDKSKSFEMKEYCVTFDSARPLGFYSVPEVVQHDGFELAVCKVVSIDPNGQCDKKDFRIQGGTIVASIRLSNCHLSVHSPRDLRMAYEQAKSSNTDIKISFVNSNVSETSIQEANARRHTDWSDSGYWTGTITHGWAGGAEAFTDIANVIAQGVQYSSTNPFSEQSLLPQVGNLNGQSKAATTRVDTQESIDVRTYDTTSRKYERRSLGDDRQGCVSEAVVAKQCKQGHDITIRKSLFDVFQRRPVLEAITVLESGAAVNVSSDDLLWLRKSSIEASQVQLQEKIQEELQSSSDQEQLQEQFQASSNLAFVKEGRDLELKDKLLSIFVNAEESVRIAKAIDKWECFDYCVTEVGGIVVDSMPLSSPSEVSITCISTSSAGEMNQWDPVAVPLLTQSLYDPPSVIYSIHCNASLTQAGKIEIQLKSKSCDGDDEIVGTAVMSASDVHTLVGSCEDSVDWTEATTLDITPSADGNLQPGAYVKVSVRRGTVDAAFMDDRCNEQQKRIRVILGLISRFNSELTPEETDSGISVSANILVGGESLLHATVRLEDCQLVEALLLLGAKPEVRGEKFNSAVELALNMLADCQKEERKAILKNIVNMLNAQLEKAVTSRAGGTGCFAVLLPVSKQSNEVMVDSPVLEVNKRVDREGLPPARLHPCQVLGAEDDELLEVTFDEQQKAAALGAAAKSRKVLKLSLPPFQRASTQTPMPMLNTEIWVLPPHSLNNRCRHHETAVDGCVQHTFEASKAVCKFIHIHKPWGDMLEELWERCEGSKNMSHDFCAHVSKHASVLCQRDSSDCACYTVKFSTLKDRDCRRDLIFAEGGESQVSSQGVHWYKSRSEALQALEKTVYVTLWAVEHGYRPGSGILGPSSQLPQMGKRAHYDDNDKDASSSFQGSKRACPIKNLDSHSSGDDVCHNDVAPMSGPGYVLMQGIPFSVTTADIGAFLNCNNVFPKSIEMKIDTFGRFSGKVVLYFSSEADARRSLSINGKYMGSRYVTLQMTNAAENREAIESQGRPYHVSSASNA